MKYDIEKIRAEYDLWLENAKYLIDEVKHRISIATKNIKIHSITPRIKGLDSFMDKIRRKRLIDPFNEVHDLIGFRVICLFLEDVHKAGDLITKEFNVFEIDDKMVEAGHDVFGYMTLQYKAKLKDTVNEIVKDYSFEIQVRTIGQDAWASISHYLDYKQESSLPANLRRDFHALSALFYIADTHFSLLRKEQSKYFVDEQLRSIDDKPRSTIE